MPSARLVCRAMLASALCAAALPAYADSYSVNPIQNDNHTLYGMDDQGNVSFTFMGVRDSTVLGPGVCYQFLSPVCGASANSRTVTAVQVAGTPLADLFVTELGNPPQEIDQVNGLGQYFINGSGDVLFDAGTADEWYEAIDLGTAVTPEPASLLLLATGVVGVAAFAMRRRFLPSV